MPLSDDDLRDMTVPVWQQVEDAIEAGDDDRARELIGVAVERTRSLQTYSINWITSLLSFVADEMGEEAVERALRRTGDEFIRPRRSGGAPWNDLPAEVRAKAIARSMVANFGTCEVDERDDRIVLSFRCGSGGRLIDERAYEPEGPYAVLRERSGRTFGRDELPVYCAHCSVNNEMQPIEWDGAPTTVEHPPRQPGEPCVHEIYRDPCAAPDETRVRLGFAPTDDG